VDEAMGSTKESPARETRRGFFVYLSLAGDANQQSSLNALFERIETGTP
jgi:hypothetical protein